MPGVVPWRLREQRHQRPVEVEAIALPLASAIGCAALDRRHLIGVARRCWWSGRQHLPVGESELNIAIVQALSLPAAFVQAVMVIAADEQQIVSVVGAAMLTVMEGDDRVGSARGQGGSVAIGLHDGADGEVIDRGKNAVRSSRPSCQVIQAMHEWHSHCCHPCRLSNSANNANHRNSAAARLAAHVQSSASRRSRGSSAGSSVCAAESIEQ